jgi:putative phosphotransacetylase
MELSSSDFKVEISARHVHLSQKDFIALFGADAKMVNVKDLSIQGEFKSDKTVTILGPKRNIERVVVLGPWRLQTQVEISLTDAYALGIKNVPLRMSADLRESAPVTLIGPAGKVELSEGMIIALRHIHINQKDMQKHNLSEGQNISIKVGTVRETTFHNVVVRKSKVDFPIVHLDTDEGNAAI